MDEPMGAEFQDWEVLLDDSIAETAVHREKSIHFGGIVGEFDSGTVIKSDYFSLDNRGRLPKSVPEGSVESDNPGWIDPSSENRVISGELWSDSGSDRSDERKLSEVDSKIELGQGGDELSGGIQKLESLESNERKISGSDHKLELGFEGFDEIQSQTKDLNKFCSGYGGDIDKSGSNVVKLEEEKNLHLESNESKISGSDPKSVLGFEGLDEIESLTKDLNKFCYDYGGDIDESGSNVVKLEEEKNLDLVSNESKISGSDPKLELGSEGSDEIQSQTKDLNNFCSDYGGDIDKSGSNVVKLEEEEKKEHLEENKNLHIEETKVNSESGNEVGDKRKVVWWKVPFEVLRYCLFKASPVWSISVAAAAMGFIILGRRLYKMKRKTQSLRLKVILDEKKGSQFMNRAARLNEAFSVVRRVPIVRPAVPASGINPWPAMSMS